jgi:hypothetical protein
MAQDGAGAVWNLAEYPEEYDKGNVTGAPGTWMAGVDNAVGGVGMPAKPAMGLPAYSQGLAPTIGFDDCATVFATGQRTCASLACYDNVLVTDEWDPGDPEGGHQRKFYAPGVGLIRVEPVGGTDPEILQLTGLAHLCPDALAQVTKEALAQDARGYRVAGPVWSRDTPAAPVAGGVSADAGSCQPAGQMPGAPGSTGPVTAAGQPVAVQPTAGGVSAAADHRPVSARASGMGAAPGYAVTYDPFPDLFNAALSPLVPVPFTGAGISLIPFAVLLMLGGCAAVLLSGRTPADRRDRYRLDDSRMSYLLGYMERQARCLRQFRRPGQSGSASFPYLKSSVPAGNLRLGHTPRKP